MEKTWHTPLEAIQGDVLLFKKGLVTKAWQVWSSNSRLVSTQPSLSPGTRNKGREVRTELFRAGAVREGIVTFGGGAQEISQGTNTLTSFLSFPSSQGTLQWSNPGEGPGIDPKPVSSHTLILREFGLLKAFLTPK